MFDNLSMREKILIGSGVGLVLIVALYLMFIEPRFDRIEQLRRMIPKKVEQLAELKELTRDLDRLYKIRSDQRKKLQARGSEPFMQSFMEQEAAQLGISIASMVPKSLDVNDEYRQDLVEMKLEKISLKDLITFLNRVETSKQMLNVKDLRIKRRYDDPTLFDVFITIATLTLITN